MALTTVSNAGLGGSIDLTAKVTGTLPIANGGTNSTSTTYCDLTANVTGLMPDSNLAAPGKVLQIVSATFGYATTTTTSYADTGLTVDITPTATSSKVLVIVNMVGLGRGPANNTINMKLLRDTTDILEFSALAGYTATTAENAVGGTGCNVLDSPSTTSATTYKVQWALSTGSTSYQIGGWYSGSIRPLSTITVMEIGA